MSPNLPVLSELLEKTLSVAALHGIDPASCEMLSLVISEKTRQQIAAVTLQRIYGLKTSVHLPSAYTLDTLSKFCGHGGWEDWCHYLKPLK